MTSHAAQTALLFPTGGYHWPGMGDDVDATGRREVFDRAEAALQSCGVAPGALRRLLAGENQARRLRTDAGWTWSGDFPLSMVAQMALGVALAEAWIERHGEPAALAGESMGELAAYCVAGALPFASAVELTYRWAQDLQKASDHLGLRMAVIEDLAAADVAQLPAYLQANAVVTEAPHLCVVALPAAQLEALDREVIARGGHTLVSNNPCAAHEPRLAAVTDLWAAHARYLATLIFKTPRLPLLGTLTANTHLADAAALAANRHDTTFHRVRWDDTLRGLPALGIGRVVLFGPPSCGYAFKKFRAGVPSCGKLRLATVATLADIGIDLQSIRGSVP
jgi:acyl transferase domain-containing protein